MHLYHITFLNKDTKICSCLKNSENEDKALLEVEFRFIALYKDVEYDNIIISQVN